MRENSPHWARRVRALLKAHWITRAIIPNPSTLRLINYIAKVCYLAGRADERKARDAR